VISRSPSLRMMASSPDGKTTLTFSLTVADVLGGKTTLVIDLDTQGTACSWHDRRKAAGKGDSPIVIDAQPHQLADTLKQARANGVHFVLIDTPPSAADAGNCPHGGGLPGD
jgi:chromosome partitioning protein